MDRERRRQEVQAALDAERSSAERNRLGQFATPPELAHQIARIALRYHSSTEVRFLEPSIGSGAFYSALLAECAPTRIKSAVGFEIDRRFVDAAREIWSGRNLQVEEADFTGVTPPTDDRSRATLIIANPPYVRHHHLDREKKTKLASQLHAVVGGKISGLAGLYVYFILRCHDWMSDDGVAAWLVPTEWMDVNYGSAVRRYLCTAVELLRVHRFEAADVQFGDALVSSSVIFFRKRPPAGTTSADMTVGDLLVPARTVRTNIVDLRQASKWSPFFLPAPEAGWRTTPSVTLGDLVEVKRGIATGDNHFFIRPRSEFRAMGIPDEFLRPVLPPSRHLADTIILRGRDGYPDIPDPPALLDCNLPEESVRTMHPALWAYFQSEAGQQARKRYLTSARRPWYAQEQRPAAPVIATYMGRGRKGHPPFRFFWNRSDATATNIYLMLIPKRCLAALLRRRPEAAKDIVEFLRGTDVLELLGHGRVYGGGLHKLEPRELGRLDATRLAAQLGFPVVHRPDQLGLGF